MATPIKLHNKNRGKSFLRIPAEALLRGDIEFPINQSNQKRITLIPTRKIFTAKGFINAGEIYFTRLKLTAKKMLVPRNAICAFVVEVRSIGFICEMEIKIVYCC